MTRYQKEIQDYTEKIQELSIQRDKNTLSIASIQQEIVDAIQIIKNKELTIFDYKRQIIQTESKIKHQLALYEAVQSDRNLHSKHLIECQSQIMEMKRKLKIMTYQINDLNILFETILGSCIWVRRAVALTEINYHIEI